MRILSFLSSFSTSYRVAFSVGQLRELGGRMHRWGGAQGAGYAAFGRIGIPVCSGAFQDLEFTPCQDAGNDTVRPVLAHIRPSA